MAENAQLNSIEDQTEEERKIVSHVREKVEEVRASGNRVAHESIWMNNIAALLGLDGVTYNASLRQFQPILKGFGSRGRNRIHVNKILPTIQNRLARLCKNPPKYDVRPESNSNEDKEAARLSLQILTTLWDELHLDKKRLFLYMWVQQCGHAWTKVCWDDTEGRQIVDPLTGELAYEGGVRVDIVSPFEVFPDPLARTDDDVLKTWLIQCKVRHLDYFKTHYPERGHLVREEQAWLLSAQYEQRINTMNTRGPNTSGNMEGVKNSAIEMVKYEARSKKHPNGRMIVCANGVLLEDKELPVGEIPFRKFDDVIIGGKFYSESVITHMRPLNEQYNAVIRRRSDWVNKMLAGKYTAPRGGGLAQESLNDQSGEVVYYTPIPNAPDGGRPSALQVPAIPQYAYAEEEKLDRMLNDISGIAEVDKGDLPSASIPAIGMQLLTEQTDTRMGVMTEQHEHAWAGTGSLILKHFEKFATLPRKLKIAGPDLSYTVKEVIGEDLRGNTDVTVIRGSTQPGSKVLKRQEIINTYQLGLLGNPADPKVQEHVLGLIEFGDVQGLWEKQGLINSQIKRGIEALEKGIPLNVSEFDNHALWLEKLDDYRISDKFDSLDPNIQALFLQTMEEHLQFVVQQSNMVPPEQPVLPEDVQPAPEMGPEQQTDPGAMPEGGMQ